MTPPGAPSATQKLPHRPGYEQASSDMETSLDGIFINPSLMSNVTLDSVLPSALPDVGSCVDQVCSVLVSRGHITHSDGVLRWSCFTAHSAVNQSDDEQVDFAPLGAIFDAVKAAAGLSSSHVLFSIGGSGILFSTPDIVLQAGTCFRLAAPSFEHLSGDALGDVVMPVKVGKVPASEDKGAVS